MAAAHEFEVALICTSSDLSGAFPSHFPSLPQTGKLLLEEKVHGDAIQDMQVAQDGSHAVTASLDKSAKLIDMETFKVLKTYNTGRLVQSACMSPIFDHVLLGGGQDASNVTTTSAKAGGFEARFFHKVGRGSWVLAEVGGDGLA